MRQPRPQKPCRQPCLHCGPVRRMRHEGQGLKAQRGPLTPWSPPLTCPAGQAAALSGHWIAAVGMGAITPLPAARPECPILGYRSRSGGQCRGWWHQTPAQAVHSQQDSPGRAAGSEGRASLGGSCRSRFGGHRQPRGHTHSSGCIWDPKCQRDMAWSSQVRASLRNEGTAGWAWGWGWGDSPPPWCAPTFLAEAGAVEGGAGEGMLAGAAPRAVRPKGVRGAQGGAVLILGVGEKTSGQLGPPPRAGERTQESGDTPSPPHLSSWHPGAGGRVGDPKNPIPPWEPQAVPKVALTPQAAPQGCPHAHTPPCYTKGCPDPKTAPRDNKSPNPSPRMPIPLCFPQGCPGPMLPLRTIQTPTLPQDHPDPRTTPTTTQNPRRTTQTPLLPLRMSPDPHSPP